jgi:hypothetical protein
MLEIIADTSDLPQQTFRMVVADLVWQIWYLVMGAHELLLEELRLPLVVVQRALFEAVTALSYLVQHTKAADEATILIAYTHLRQLEVFHDQAELARERKAILARMPVHLVAEARRRVKRDPRTWSGKTIAQMAREGKVQGYKPMYGYSSAEAHISIVGEHVRVESIDDRHVRLVTGRELSPSEIETQANFARRQLHGAFKVLWGVLDGPKIEFRGTDPNLWNPPTGDGQ